MRILYVGPDFPGSNGTCWRDAFLGLGHEVVTLDDEEYARVPRGMAGRARRRIFRRPSTRQIAALNSRLLREARAFKPEMIFFVKAYYVLPETLDQTRKIGLNFAYMNDDMFVPRARTFTFFDNIRRMDCILTTKSFSVREYHAAGAPFAVYVPNAYDPDIHYPAVATNEERRLYEADVAFIGAFSPSKADVLSKLAQHKNEFSLKIWGPGWHKMMRFDYWHHSWKWLGMRDCVHGSGLFCAEMGKAIQSTKIMLGLLTKEVRDLHTSRSFEIPACGGFMLAERTEEHRMYLEEDREAVYFASYAELVDKIRFYLAHDELRKQIAAAGYQKVLRLKARYLDRAEFAINQYKRLRYTQIAPAAKHSEAIAAGN